MTTAHQTTRRALVAGVAFVTSAAALPAIAAVQSSDTADPIFAAIERWQRTRTEIDRFDAKNDSESPDAEAAVSAVWEARLLLAETAPTTLAGLAAYVSFLRCQSVDELETFFFDESGEHDEQLAFIESLDRSLASIVAAREAVRS